MVPLATCTRSSGQCMCYSCYLCAW